MGGPMDRQKRWVEAGRELQRRDGKRFDELLEIAERIVQVHQDPMSVPLPHPKRVRRNE